MKHIYIFLSLMSLTTFAADPQAAMRAAQQAHARRIAGEAGEATRAFAPHTQTPQRTQTIQPFTPLYEPDDAQTDTHPAKAA